MGKKATVPVERKLGNKEALEKGLLCYNNDSVPYGASTLRYLSVAIEGAIIHSHPFADYVQRPRRASFKRGFCITHPSLLKLSLIF